MFQSTFMIKITDLKINDTVDFIQLFGRISNFKNNLNLAKHLSKLSFET